MVIARLQLGGVRRAVSKLAAESAAPALPVGKLEVKAIGAQPGHAAPTVQICVQAGNASLPAAVSSASSETSDGMSSASAW
jgi:hypothetical protein